MFPRISFLVATFLLLERLTSSPVNCREISYPVERRWNENNENVFETFSDFVPPNQARNEQYNEDQAAMSLPEDEKRKLEAIYRPEVVKQHYKDFVQVGQMIKRGAREHKIPWGSAAGTQPINGLDKEIIDDALLSAVNPPEINSNDVMDGNWNQVPLQKDYKFEDGVRNGDEIRQYGGGPLVTVRNGQCNIHGVWLSTVAGAAIELLPIMEGTGHIEIRTKIFDQFNGSRKGILSSKWTGSGMISRESPTTITIVFQEHIDNTINSNQEYNSQAYSRETAFSGNVPLPRTAVFVGQCLLCDNSPVLQGTWVVFPNTQNCVVGADKSISNYEVKSAETLHLLKH